MGRKRQAPEETMQKLRRAGVEVAKGATVAQACRKVRAPKVGCRRLTVGKT